MAIFEMKNKGIQWCAGFDMDVATSWHGQFKMLRGMFIVVEFTGSVNIKSNIIDETFGDNWDGDFLVL